MCRRDSAKNGLPRIQSIACSGKWWSSVGRRRKRLSELAQQFEKKSIRLWNGRRRALFRMRPGLQTMSTRKANSKNFSQRRRERRETQERFIVLQFSAYSASLRENFS